MKPMKLTSIMMMLLLSWGVSAQGQFFDDIYYSSKSEDKEKEEVEKPVKEVQEEEEIATDMTSDEYDLTSTYTRSGASLEEERDVDEYNRRYSDYPEDEWEEVEQDTGPVNTKVSVEPERRSDLEYSERIIRYHSPSKISIVGADQVDLYVDDGYYAYDYATDYSGGITNVSVNLNFGSPWYSWGWYDPWYYPWGGYYSSWWYRPYHWGWGGWYAGWYDPWYDPWWGPSWGWGGWYAGWHGGWGYTDVPDIPEVRDVHPDMPAIYGVTALILPDAMPEQYGVRGVMPGVILQETRPLCVAKV